MPPPSHICPPAVSSSNVQISSPTLRVGQRNEHTSISRARQTSVFTQPLRHSASTRQWSDSPVQPAGLSSSPPTSSIVGRRSIHRYGHSDMTRLVNETTRLVERFMWLQQPFMNSREVEQVSFIIPMADTDTRSKKHQSSAHRVLLERSYGKYRHTLHYLRIKCKGDIKGCLYSHFSSCITC